MKILPRKTRNAALTMIELWIVVPVIALLATIILPALAHRNARASRIQCSSNLKQIGMSEVDPIRWTTKRRN